MFRKLLIILAFSFCVIAVPQRASAAESIQNFHVDITAHNDGTMSVVENIEYDFNDVDRHGIYRVIPTLSRVGELYRVIKIDFDLPTRDGVSDNYSIDENASEVQIKIGDPDKTITGKHSYQIRYTVKNGIGSNYDDHDEIYWNVTGNEWNVDIASASASIKTDFGIAPTKAICFTGAVGSRAKECSIDTSNTQFVTRSPLLAGEGLTIVSAFPVGTFPKSTLQKDKPLDPDLSMFLKILGVVYIFLNFLLAPYLLYWYNKRKNKKRFGPPSVNFDIPELSKGQRIIPAESGVIDHFSLKQDDLVATIFDLAIRKYIKIEQVEKEGIIFGIGGGTDYKIIKLKEFDDLTPFEKYLLEQLLGSKEEALIKETKVKYSDFQELQKKIYWSVENKKLFEGNYSQLMSFLMGLGIITTVIGNLIFGPVLIYLSRKLNGRTEAGDEADWKTDGLKLFLKNMSREYKWQAENLYTVEKYIPYAMSLGYIDQFMDQLKVLYPDYQPTWYAGSHFYGNYAFFESSMNSSFVTSAPSSSSGFSGGSSGGGGGGGGGGSW
jgi:uncharacterized membrane protein